MLSWSPQLTTRVNWTGLDVVDSWEFIEWTLRRNRSLEKIRRDVLLLQKNSCVTELVKRGFTEYRSVVRGCQKLVPATSCTSINISLSRIYRSRYKQTFTCFTDSYFPSLRFTTFRSPLLHRESIARDEYFSLYIYHCRIAQVWRHHQRVLARNEWDRNCRKWERKGR